MPHREYKNKTGIIIIIFRILIDIDLFSISLLLNKIYKVITIIALAPCQNFFILKKTQFFISYFSIREAIAKLG